MRKTPFVVAVAGFVLGGMLLTAVGCSHRSAAAPEEPSAKEAPVVGFAYPKQQMVHRTVEQPAHIEAFEQTAIEVKIAGYVKKVYVSVSGGTSVKAGAPLADLYVPEMEVELLHKQQLVTQAEIDIQLARKSLDVASANVQTTAALAEEARASRGRAQANFKRWESEATRMKGLAQDKVISEQGRDEVVKQFEASEAALKESAARINSADAAHRESGFRKEKAEAEVSAAQNRLKLAQTEVKQVATMLEYTHLTAPFDGIVIWDEKTVTTDALLQPPSGPSPSTKPPFIVVKTDKVRVYLDVPESDAVLIKWGAGLHEGSPARIRVPALNDREFTGNVVGCSWIIDPLQRTLRTEIDLPNPDGMLRPGTYAQAIVDVNQLDWTLPAKAVIIRDGQTFCYCLENGKAVRTVVKIGYRDGDVLQVLKKQTRPTRSREEPRWVDFTGSEFVVTEKVGELIDGQEAVRGAPEEVPTTRER
jgi:HlyD family secretion protein